MADLREEQWRLVQSFIPTSITETSRGRPPVDPRKVLNGILWIMRTGAPWADLPPRYGAYQTCHRYFQQWVENWVFDSILRALAEDLRRRGKIDLSECFIDATFVGAKKGVRTLDLQRLGKGPRSWQFQTAMVFLSPFVLPQPISTKENWLKGPLITVSSAQSQEDWWEIRHTMTMVSIEDVEEDESA
jgi:transposase